MVAQEHFKCGITPGNVKDRTCYQNIPDSIPRVTIRWTLNAVLRQVEDQRDMKKICQKRNERKWMDVESINLNQVTEVLCCFP